MEHAPIDPHTARREPFRVGVRVEDGVCRVRPLGELYLATVPLLEDELMRVEDTSVSAIELDLSAVSFMDSSGLHALLRAGARARADSNRLRIVRPTGQVGRLLALSGAQKLLPLAGSES